MMRTVLFYLALGLSGFSQLSCAVHGAESEVTLVKEGRSSFVILHGPNASGSVRIAAQELQHYLEATTKAKLAIIASDEQPPSPFIALGDTAAARDRKSVV